MHRHRADNAHAVRIPSVEAHGLVAAAGEQCAEPAPVGMIAVFGRVRRKAVHGCGHRVISSVSSDILTRMARAVPPSSAMRSGPPRHDAATEAAALHDPYDDTGAQPQFHQPETMPFIQVDAVHDDGVAGPAAGQRAWAACWGSRCRGRPAVWCP